MNHTPSPSAARRGSPSVPMQGILLGSGSLCRLCIHKLKREDGDDIERRLCASCKDDPVAKDLLPLVTPSDASFQAPTVAPIAAAPQTSRGPFANMVADVTGGGLPVTPPTVSFTDADFALIRRIGAFMPVHKLLEILNERRACDLGTDKDPTASSSWWPLSPTCTGPRIRPLLGATGPACASCSHRPAAPGVLEQINNQVIDDFAVVFQLNAKQVVELKDIVLGAKED
jgi:hypothetical protein